MCGYIGKCLEIWNMVDYEEVLYFGWCDDFFVDYDVRNEREGSRESDYDDRD